MWRGVTSSSFSSSLSSLLLILPLLFFQPYQDYFYCFSYSIVVGVCCLSNFLSFIAHLAPPQGVLRQAWFRESSSFQLPPSRDTWRTKRAPPHQLRFLVALILVCSFLTLSQWSKCLHSMQKRKAISRQAIPTINYVPHCRTLLVTTPSCARYHVVFGMHFLFFVFTICSFVLHESWGQSTLTDLFRTR